jgi:hypothetical protein
VILGAYPHGTAVASEAASTVVTQWSDTEPFLLRTLTHLCAPGFAMLMGMGLAYWSASRNARGTPPREQVSHLLKRGLALLLVNQVTFLLLSVRPPYFIVFNAVLWALAIDYVCVGGMTIAIEHWLQPTLGLRFARPPPEPLPSEASKAKADGERHASMFVDAVLLLLSAVSLWANVWTSDNQGACTAAEAHTTAGWPASAEWCRLDAPRFWYKLAFGVVQCVNIHVMSAFPPIGWLSFVLFGLLYGRVLVRARWARHTVGVFNASLAVIFGGLFAATRLLQFGNLSTDCLRTPDQLGLPAGANQYLASWRSFLYVTKVRSHRRHHYAVSLISSVAVPAIAGVCLPDAFGLLSAAGALLAAGSGAVLGRAAAIRPDAALLLRGAPDRHSAARVGQICGWSDRAELTSFCPSL